MASARSIFDSLLHDHLIPEFCADQSRGCSIASFNAASVRVSEWDAQYFLMAWDAGLITHQGRGLYRAASSTASEQFFWEGRKSPAPRSFSLWLEPVITVAALARLRFDFGWPGHLTGTQSVDWAFDLITRRSDETEEFIAGEIKKSQSEFDALIIHMHEYGKIPTTISATATARARNAYKKVAALRARKAPIFWAVGPDRLSRVFNVAHGADGTLDLVPTTEAALRYPR